jgi:hypothetical protein
MKILQNVFKNILDTISLSKDEIRIAKFFTLNRHNLQKIFTNDIDVSNVASLLFAIKDKHMLEGLLEAALADLNGRIGKSQDLVFDKEQIVTLWRLLKEADYGVDHKNMSVKRIKSTITRKQAEIVKIFVENYAQNLNT